MWRTEGDPRYDLPDAARFVEMFNEHAGPFQRDLPVVVTRAPGRLDLMGGIADYSGSLVLQMSVARNYSSASRLRVATRP